MHIKIVAISFFILNMCYGADEEPGLQVDGAGLHRVYEQEEKRLKARPDEFWKAFTPNIDRMRDWSESRRALRAKKSKVDTTILTRQFCNLYRPADFEGWLALRFPRKQLKRWIAHEDGLALFPQNSAHMREKFNEDMARLADEMMEERRRITGRFGAMGVALGDKKAVAAARQKGDTLLERLIAAPDALEETAFLGVFQPLEGDELAYLRYEAYKAGRAFRRVQSRMEASDTAPLQANIHAQMKELLKGHIGHMMRHKLRFYREVLLFFYKGDLGAFNAKTGGIDDLWAHLSKYQADFKKVRIIHEGEDMGADSGMRMYGFLQEYQKLYREERAKAKELLEEIQAGRAKIPHGETAVFKQLADPVVTFDLDKEFKEAEKGALRRIHHIVSLEKELSVATGGLTVTEVEQKAEEAKKAYHAYAQAYDAMIEAYNYYLYGPQEPLSLTDS